MSRNERSFMSMHRRQVIVSGSMPKFVPVQEVGVDEGREQVVRGRDRVEVPVRWRLRSSIGTTWA